MYRYNKGYVGYSRSVRSYEAIQDYEVPISHFTRTLIDEFLSLDLNERYREKYKIEDEDVSCYFSESDIEMLKKAPISLWKKIAKQHGETSWHHTSKFFNETSHYDLLFVSQNLLFYFKNIDSANNWLSCFINDYRKCLKNKMSTIFIDEYGDVRDIPDSFEIFCNRKRFSYIKDLDFSVLLSRRIDEYIRENCETFSDDEEENEIFRGKWYFLIHRDVKRKCDK